MSPIRLSGSPLIDESQPADVIFVMGAAEYRGHPSPVFQRRLNHALLLYLKHMAPYILTTGGAGGDPDFTEGEVGPRLSCHARRPSRGHHHRSSGFNHRTEPRRRCRNHAPHEPAFLHRRERRLSHLPSQARTRSPGLQSVRFSAASRRQLDPNRTALALSPPSRGLHAVAPRHQHLTALSTFKPRAELRLDQPA